VLASRQLNPFGKIREYKFCVACVESVLAAAHG
jgi:hypothetical protein